MDNVPAINALSALAQSTRLDTFRLLVKHEPDGLPAGEVARLLGVPQNTMSAHLATLARAGLVRSERQSRSVIYRADLDQLRELMLFLVNDCCGGRADLCAPLISSLTPGCFPDAAFTALPMATLERVSLTAKLPEIGQAEGASSPRPDVA